MGFRLVIADHVRFPCVHAAATTPAQRLNVSLRSFRPDVSVFPERLWGRPAHCPFRGLLGVHSRCGLHTRAVTNSWHANQRLQPLRYLHDCSDCSGWSYCRGACTHWKASPLHGAHPERTSGPSHGTPRGRKITHRFSSSPTEPRIGRSVDRIVCR
jgi:hypothetical protein